MLLTRNMTTFILCALAISTIAVLSSTKTWLEQFLLLRGDNNSDTNRQLYHRNENDDHHGNLRMTSSPPPNASSLPQNTTSTTQRMLQHVSYHILQPDGSLKQRQVDIDVPVSSVVTPLDDNDHVETEGGVTQPSSSDYFSTFRHNRSRRLVSPRNGNNNNNCNGGDEESDDDEEEDLRFYRKTLPTPVRPSAYQRHRSLHDNEDQENDGDFLPPDNIVVGTSFDVDTASKSNYVFPAILVGIATAVAVCATLLLVSDVRDRFRHEQQQKRKQPPREGSKKRNSKPSSVRMIDPSLCSYGSPRRVRTHRPATPGGYVRTPRPVHKTAARQPTLGITGNKYRSNNNNKKAGPPSSLMMNDLLFCVLDKKPSQVSVSPMSAMHSSSNSSSSTATTVSHHLYQRDHMNKNQMISANNGKNGATTKLMAKDRVENISELIFNGTASTTNTESFASVGGVSRGSSDPLSNKGMHVAVNEQGKEDDSMKSGSTASSGPTVQTPPPCDESEGQETDIADSVKDDSPFAGQIFEGDNVVETNVTHKERDIQKKVTRPDSVKENVVSTEDVLVMDAGTGLEGSATAEI